MLKTFVMNGSRQKIELTRLGVDKEKMADYLTPQDNANQISNSYGQLQSGICLSTDPNNSDYVYIAERADADAEDCIALGTGGSIERPLTDVKALNELRVMGQNGDVVYVQAL